MNLVLSMQAAKDRIEARNDFLVNQKAEEEIRAILEHLDAQNQALVQIHQQLANIESRLGIEDKGLAAGDHDAPILSPLAR